MAVLTPDPTTAPPPLTAAQARALRALFHTLQSRAPNNAPRPAMVAPQRPAAAAMPVHFQQPIQQRNINIDASTRIMGHCNNVALASPSSTEQAFMIKEAFHGVLLQPMSLEEKENATANSNKAHVNLNVVVQAGVNIMGSKNVVVVNGNGNGNGHKRDVISNKDDNSNDTTKVENALPPRSAAERKRRAESEPAISHHQTTLPKKVKVEE